MTGRRGPRPASAHGTPARYRRHYRDGEPPCEACRAAGTAARGVSAGSDPYSSNSRPLLAVPPPRNGMPESGGYCWRSRPLTWARQVLARAEAEWGRPGP